MKYVYILFISALLLTCSNQEKNFNLSGSIKGLKKGTVYLEVFNDSNFITVDSFKVYNSPDFKLNCNLEYPNLLRLRLDKNKKVQYTSDFFGTIGETFLNTSLKNFNKDIVITGSEHTKLYEEYQEMIKSFNSKNLDLIVEGFNAQKSNDTALANEITKKQQGLLKRKILFALNFGVNHNDSEVAPFIAITDLPDVKSPLIDSLYNNLTPRIKDSYYGKKLKKQLSK